MFMVERLTHMGMNIKNEEAYRLTKELAQLTGESLTTAITEAVRERLNRIRRERGVDLAEHLLAIGRDCAAHLKEPFRTINHDEMLYDKQGLPK
jgi:antitoxin VapB